MKIIVLFTTFSINCTITIKIWKSERSRFVSKWTQLAGAGLSRTIVNSEVHFTNDTKTKKGPKLCALSANLFLYLIARSPVFSAIILLLVINKSIIFYFSYSVKNSESPEANGVFIGRPKAWHKPVLWTLKDFKRSMNIDTPTQPYAEMITHNKQMK